MSGDETANPPSREGDRIAKWLARAGVASRRDAERMIAEGRISLNGATVSLYAPHHRRRLIYGHRRHPPPVL